LPLLMIFIDGFGLGGDDPTVNPLAAAEMPFIRGLCGGKPLTLNTVGPGLSGPELMIRPIDATLGMPGLPQSATGQTSFLTGVNAPQLAGRHVNGFPSTVLREVLNEQSIFRVINEAGKRAVFANAFTSEYFDAVAHGKWRHSATTIAALAGGCKLGLLPELIKGKTVYQDITNELLIERGYDVPVITPETAAANLAAIAGRNDYTLFEYFQTDFCGHARDHALALTLLNRLDRFLGAVHKQLRKLDLTLIIISDHGNIEDLSVKTHTINPVPLTVLGQDAGQFAEVEDISRVYGAVVRYFGVTNCH
jgi:2,3-bisphosphoglycerate-independent phosphoglycerate mutase